jgi:hypothetical protein
MIRTLIMTLSMMLSITAITESQTIANAESDSKDEKKYDKLKEICSNYGDGEWKDGECKITDIEERGAYEDYACDHPREGIPYDDIC